MKTISTTISKLTARLTQKLWRDSDLQIEVVYKNRTFTVRDAHSFAAYAILDHKGIRHDVDTVREIQEWIRLTVAAEIEREEAHDRARELTHSLTAFNSFEDLLEAKGNYRPSMDMRYAAAVELADLYDAAQEARGDNRRAYRYGAITRL